MRALARQRESSQRQRPIAAPMVGDRVTWSSVITSFYFSGVVSRTGPGRVSSSIRPSLASSPWPQQASLALAQWLHDFREVNDSPWSAPHAAARTTVCRWRSRSPDAVLKLVLTLVWNPSPAVGVRM